MKLTQALLNQEKAREQYWTNQAKASEVAPKVYQARVEIKQMMAAEQLRYFQGAPSISRLVSRQTLNRETRTL